MSKILEMAQAAQVISAKDHARRETEKRERVERLAKQRAELEEGLIGELVAMQRKVIGLHVDVSQKMIQIGEEIIELSVYQWCLDGGYRGRRRIGNTSRMLRYPLAAQRILLRKRLLQYGQVPRGVRQVH